MAAECSYGGEDWEEHPKCHRQPRWSFTFPKERGYYCDRHVGLARSAFGGVAYEKEFKTRSKKWGGNNA